MGKIKKWLIDDMYADVHRWIIASCIIFLLGFLGFPKSNWWFIMFPLSIITFSIKCMLTGAREY